MVRLEPLFSDRVRVSVTDVPFDLAEVKLAAPSIRPGTVAKEDVIARLSAAGVPFVTVVAPAGYGKTTLLARWAEADPRPFAWVVLDARDSDAVVFLRYIAAAIHRVEPVSPEVFDALSGPGGSTWAKRVPRVGGALAALERPLVLVLDDLHLVANPSCLDVLAELVQYVPAGSQIAIASREEPALPLARWRTNGQVHEIGVADLRLDEQEAALLLGAAGVELDARELSDLTERTEGWPAGLYLAALSMQTGAAGSLGWRGLHAATIGSCPSTSAIELLSRRAGRGSDLPQVHVGAGAYVGRALRCRAPDDGLRTHARHARARERLRRATGPAARVVSLPPPVRSAAAERARAERAGRGGRAKPSCDGLVHRQRPDGGSGRLRARCGRDEHRRNLVEGLLLPLYFDGRMQTAEEWFGWFGEDELVQHPALAVYGAWIRVLTGRPEDAERLLALADGATSTGPLADGSATIEPWIATLRAHMMRDGVERALADANLALDRLPPGSWWIPGSLRMRGVAHGLLGATDRETEDLKASITEAQALGAPGDDVPLAMALLALRAAKQGAWGEAAERARAAQAIVDEKGLGDYATSALVHAATARVALHEGGREEARAALARAHRLRPLLDHGLPWLAVEVGLELTRAHLALGEASAARTVFSETERVLELRPDLGSLVEEARELRERLAATSGPAGAWAMSLTGAELRLLPYLATHLTVPEIATRLFISRNTVKTEAVSIYRKLGASSRSQAIERAVEVGLLESSLYPPRANLTQEV